MAGYGGVLLLLFGAALVLFLRAWSNSDEMAAYVAHSFTGFACLLAVGAGLGAHPPVLTVAASIGFCVNFFYLVRRIRHS